MYHPYGENKGADQLRSICAFVFAYTKIRFSHDAAHVPLTRILSYSHINFQVKITDMQIQGVQRDLLPGDPVCAPAMVVMSEALISLLKNLHKNRAWTDVISEKITTQMDKVKKLSHSIQ